MRRPLPRFPLSMNHSGALPPKLLPVHKARLPALLAAIVLLSGILLSAHTGELEREQQISEAQTKAQGELSAFRAQLETDIYASLALVRGMATDLAQRDSTSSEQFMAIARELQLRDPQISGVALAPDFVISDAYPDGDGRPLSGFNLLTAPESKDPVLRAISAGDMVLAGPLPTAQGDQVLAGWIPIWIDRNGAPKFWGFAGVTLDYRALMDKAGLARLQQELVIDIRGRDAMGPAGERFFGRAAPMSRMPLKVPVLVPGGSWLISAYPPEGWNPTPWWRTRNGAFGLLVSVLSALASFRILYDRQRIRLLAGLDPLTRLPNRRQALRHLERLLDRGTRNGSHFALLSIDLDGFKPVNDRLGHAAGDRLLETIGARLGDSVRAGDLAARMGGDEFLLILREEQTLADDLLLDLARRVESAIAQPVDVGRESVTVHASIGIATFPEHGSDAMSLLQRADEAMYQAKREHRGGSSLAGRTA
jgi:diguanylate cyclase (GGDEF)-like protein